jgi:hypothetical protein
MAKTEHHDQARLQAAQAGLPPDVHDPATLAAYTALRGGGEQAEPEPEAEPEPKAKTTSSKTGSRKR